MLTTRLENQKLVGSSLSRPEAVVAWLGAVQAQDYTGAKWALALRLRDASDADIEQAFTDGRILRTHVLRPTWHFVVPADIRWMVALGALRLRRINRLYALRLGLDERTLNLARAVVERVLPGGVTMTRDEIARALRATRIEAAGQRLAHLLFELEQQAVICSGPTRGRKNTYALFDERVPPGPGLSRDEALGTLAKRYFESHGPATAKDYAWWSGLTMREARIGIEIARVQPLLLPPRLQRVPDAHYLLPNYDEYLIAYRDRGAVIDPERARNLGVFSSSEFPHHVVIDGRVAGSWRRTITETALTIEVATYRRLSGAKLAALRQQCERYGRFLRRPATLRLQ